MKLSASRPSDLHLPCTSHPYPDLNHRLERSYIRKPQERCSIWIGRSSNISCVDGGPRGPSTSMEVLERRRNLTVVVPTLRSRGRLAVCGPKYSVICGLKSVAIFITPGTMVVADLRTRGICGRLLSPSIANRDPEEKSGLQQ